MILVMIWLLLCFAALQEYWTAMKYLLWVALFFLVLWAVRKVRAFPSEGRPSVSHAPESMVKCAYCGIHQPASESVLSNGRYYCGLEHRHEAESHDD